MAAAFYDAAMNLPEFPAADSPELMAAVGTSLEPASRPGAGSSPGVLETDTLWTQGEGQVVNALPFVLGVTLCWLVVPALWALLRYLQTTRHRYTLTNARLLEESGLIVKKLETVELYRVKDISVGGTVLQRLFGRGRVVVKSTDTTMPTLVLNAVPDPLAVSQMIRDAVETCRTARGVRAFDF